MPKKKNNPKPEDRCQPTAPSVDVELFAPEVNGFEASLDLWEKKLKDPEAWIQSPIQKWQMEQLQTHRPQLFRKPTATGEPDASTNIEGGYRGVANWIRNNYQGKLSRLPSHTDISNWTKGEFLPVPCRENFPSSDANNSRYKTALVMAWVEKYLVKSVSGRELDMPLDYRQAQEKLDYERSADEYRVWRQANSDKYISVEQADADAVGLLQRHHAFTRRAAEKLFKAGVVKNLRKLAAFTEEQLTVIGEACVATGKEVVSAIEDSTQGTTAK